MKMFQETPWEEMPPRPRCDAPEAKHFLVINHEVSKMALHQHRPTDVYREMYTSMTRQIVDYFLNKHSEELRRGQSQMVAVQEDYMHYSKKVQMGVYILTPQEMDELKAEWFREYQSRKETHS